MHLQIIIYSKFINFYNNYFKTYIDIFLINWKYKFFTLIIYLVKLFSFLKNIIFYF